MRCLFVLTDQMNQAQLDNSYLLCIAMLNFEHEVDVIFLDRAFTQISQHVEQKKKWLALKLYGVNTMYQFNATEAIGTDNHLTTISQAELSALKAAADYIS